MRSIMGDARIARIGIRIGLVLKMSLKKGPSRRCSKYCVLKKGPSRRRCK